LAFEETNHISQEYLASLYSPISIRQPLLKNMDDLNTISLLWSSNDRGEFNVPLKNAPHFIHSIIDQRQT